MTFAYAMSTNTMSEHHGSPPEDRALTEDSPMQLPQLSEPAVDAFRVLADFQDVIDSAADAGLIDDEAAVVFHRQLIAWTRGDSARPADVAAQTIVAAAQLRASEIIEDAQEAAAREVAQVRSLTIAECDEILAAARAAAARLVDDAMAAALA